MTDNRSYYKRQSPVGPGGMKCACCAPAPGKERKSAKRRWKRIEKRESLKEARNEI
jgi:hypothetical protein